MREKERIDEFSCGGDSSISRAGLSHQPSEDGMMTESSSYHAGWIFRELDE
jgi:hypothetical protein